MLIGENNLVLDVSKDNSISMYFTSQWNNQVNNRLMFPWTFYLFFKNMHFLFTHLTPPPPLNIGTVHGRNEQSAPANCPCEDALAYCRVRSKDVSYFTCFTYYESNSSFQYMCLKPRRRPYRIIFFDIHNLPYSGSKKITLWQDNCAGLV